MKRVQTAHAVGIERSVSDSRGRDIDTPLGLPVHTPCPILVFPLCDGANVHPRARGAHGELHELGIAAGW
jgi:hypothetical protein